MSSSSPFAKWARAVDRARAKKDANRLLGLEHERLANPKAMLLAKHGVLGIAAAGLDEWATDVALAWDTPKPEVDEALCRLVSRGWEKDKAVQGRHELGKRLARKLMGFASMEHLQRFWDEELTSPLDSRWLMVPTSWFVELGVDVAQLREMNPSTPSSLNTDTPLPRFLPDSYADLCAQALERGSPPRWSPLMACFLHGNSQRIFELVGAGLDPWATDPGSILPDWSLAGALGLDPMRTMSPSLEDSDGVDVSDSPVWGSVRAVVMEKKLSRALIDVSAPAPTRPAPRL